MVFTTGCRGILALVPRAPPPPLSSLPLVFTQFFLSHILYPKLHVHINFFSFFKYVDTEVLLSFLIGLDLASSVSILEPDSTDSVDMGGSFWQLLTSPLHPTVTKIWS